jgi:cell division transport system permease protein
LGALIAVIILVGTLSLAYKEIPDLVILRNYMEFAVIFVGVIGLGIFISGFSTFLAVNKFLRLKIYNLYR